MITTIQAKGVMSVAIIKTNFLVYRHLVDRYGMSVSQMTTDMFHLL
jgi:hypothetical protein